MKIKKEIGFVLTITLLIGAISGCGQLLNMVGLNTPTSSIHRDALVLIGKSLAVGGSDRQSGLDSKSIKTKWIDDTKPGWNERSQTIYIGDSPYTYSIKYRYLNPYAMENISTYNTQDYYTERLMTVVNQYQNYEWSIFWRERKKQVTPPLNASDPQGPLVLQNSDISQTINYTITINASENFTKISGITLNTSLKPSSGKLVFNMKMFRTLSAVGLAPKRPGNELRSFSVLMPFEIILNNGKYYGEFKRSASNLLSSAYNETFSLNRFDVSDAFIWTTDILLNGEIIGKLQWDEERWTDPDSVKVWDVNGNQVF